MPANWQGYALALAEKSRSPLMTADDKEWPRWYSGYRRTQESLVSKLYTRLMPMSFGATRIFQSMLFGTKPLAPVVLSGVIGTLLRSRFWPVWLPHGVLP